MQLGFVIDQSRCIGCHACSVACKQENDVPLGGFRTWVKYVEAGTFPEVDRHFAVLRCNQCTRPPCAAICPTGALQKRADGVVDLDRDACVGCRACLQACPYEALHFDDSRGVASKCHFCAHRVEKSLAPACVSVCPTQALLPVDLHDPADRQAAAVREGRTTVRRPEFETGPNVHYVAASPLALVPEAAHRDSAWLWAERTPGRPEVVGVGPDGARVVLEPVHRVPWGWHVTTFLLVKGAESGLAFLAPLTELEPAVVSGIAAVGTAVVAALMVADLGRPERFLYLLTRGNPKSWLVRGAWLLMVYGTVQGFAFVGALLGATGLAEALGWAGAAMAPAVAGYSAQLFGQCEGRPFWAAAQAWPRLLSQALTAGGALAVALGATALVPAALAGLAVYAAVAWSYRASADPAGPYLRSARPWGLAPLAGLALGAAALLGALVVPALALLVIPALYVEDTAWLRAGQLPPNS